jgi:hypothetical protein
VEIWASARWNDELSGLRVTATVIFPNGTRQLILLSDDKYDKPNSGLYEGFIKPQTEGRYRVIIRIENKDNSSEYMKGKKEGAGSGLVIITWSAWI